jgi:hypothetical protein
MLALQLYVNAKVVGLAPGFEISAKARNFVPTNEFAHGWELFGNPAKHFVPLYEVVFLTKLEPRWKISSRTNNVKQKW